MSRTRFPKGVSTSSTNHEVLSNYPGLDVTKTHEFFNDFDAYTAADWTVTSGTVALADVDGGAITLTNGALIADLTVITKKGVSFLPDAQHEMWFETTLQVSDANKSTVVVGLANVTADPFTLANLVGGFFFNKPAAANAIDFYSRKDATTNSQKATAVGSMVTATNIIMGFYYDGNGKVSFFLNDNKVGELTTTAANFPGSALTPIVGVKNGEAVAKVLTLDYVFASKMR